MEPRHFENPYQDYDPTSPALIEEKITNFVKSLIHKNVKMILENTNPKITNLKSRPDIYVGLSGISFMFLKLSQSAIKDDFASYNGIAKLYSDCASEILATSGADKFISLLSGNAGVAAVSAAVNRSTNNDEDVRMLLNGITAYENPSYLDDGADEVLVGRCGYLLGILWLERQLQREILSVNEMNQLAKVIIKSGKSYAKRYKLEIPLMYQYHGREYLGAAHGVSAILLSLLMVPLSENDLNDVRRTIDAILTLQDESGNFPSKFNKLGANLVHWCHGAPGIVYLMAKAYKTFGDKKYLDSCLKCGDLIWSKGLLRKGPGICHGVAGNGYAHLLLYRLTGDHNHLYRAMKFAEFLTNDSFLQEARSPDRPFSLFEGLSGTICFLIDVLQPDKAEFPFMNIF